MAAKHNRLIGFSVEENELIERAAAITGVSVSRFVRDYATWAARIKVTGGAPADGMQMRAALVDIARGEAERRVALMAAVMQSAARVRTALEKLAEFDQLLLDAYGDVVKGEDEQGGT